MTITLSRNLAIVIGIVTPVLETIRRWSTWTEYPPAFSDDFVLGGLLPYGKERTGFLIVLIGCITSLKKVSVFD